MALSAEDIMARCEFVGAYIQLCREGKRLDLTQMFAVPKGEYFAYHMDGEHGIGVYTPTGFYGVIDEGVETGLRVDTTRKVHAPNADAAMNVMIQSLLDANPEVRQAGAIEVMLQHATPVVWDPTWTTGDGRTPLNQRPMEGCESTVLPDGRAALLTSDGERGTRMQIRGADFQDLRSYL